MTDAAFLEPQRSSERSDAGSRARVADADHLDWLESEAIHILREVAGQCRNPALLFSGGKDSLVLLRLAEKAFPPRALSVSAAAHRHRAQLSRSDRVPRRARRGAGRAPDRALGRGFDRRAAASSCATPTKAATAHQSVTLLDAIAEFGFDACIGGARRDEEKARAKERIFSFRDEFGQWDPKNQRPELWNLYNARVAPGRARARVPDQQLDRARRLAIHRARAARSAVDLLRASRGRSCAAAARWCRSPS